MIGNSIRTLTEIEVASFFEYMEKFDEYTSMVSLLKGHFDHQYIVLRSDYDRLPIADFQYSTNFPVVIGNNRAIQSLILYSAMLYSNTDMIIISSLERRSNDSPMRIPGILQVEVSPYGVLDCVSPDIVPPHKVIGIGSNSPTIFLLFKDEHVVDASNFADFFRNNCHCCLVNVFDDDTFVLLKKHGPETVDQFCQFKCSNEQ